MVFRSRKGVVGAAKTEPELKVESWHRRRMFRTNDLSTEPRLAPISSVPLAVAAGLPIMENLNLRVFGTCLEIFTIARLV
jgi:hypothetical protein